MTLNEQALELHKQWQGKLETASKSPVKSRQDLSLAYTPGVAEPCKVIAENKDGKLALRTDICAPDDVACEHLYVYKISK